MGDEGSRVRPTGLDVQHRCLDLDEALAGQRAAEATDHGVTNLEGATGLFVHDEIGVTLTETGVGVG